MSSLGPYRTHLCKGTATSQFDAVVKVSGWLETVRPASANVAFAKLRDSTGDIQLVFEEASLVERIGQIKRESVISVEGILRARPASHSRATPNGDRELAVASLTLLNECESVPFSLTDHTREELRLRHRYYDLRRSEMQQALHMRASMLKAARKVFEANGFLEVETPTLFRTTPEGAAEYLVMPKRLAGRAYSLAQSPQQFKQMLMTGGVDRYYQVARCYRDEDLRADRQAEFTQIDFELSFADVSVVQSLTEQVVSSALSSALGRSIPTPFERISFQSAFDTYGVDKPDTRFGYKIENVTSALKPILSQISRHNDTLTDTHTNAHSSNTHNDTCSTDSGAFAVTVSGGRSLSRAQFDSVIAQTQLVFPHFDLVTRVIGRQNDGHRLSGWTQLSDADGAHGALSSLSLSDRTLIVIGDPEHSKMFLGQFRLKMADFMEEHVGPVRDNSAMNLLWVTDFPLLSRSDEGAVESTHHPFTAPHPDDIHLIDTLPFNVRGLHYDLVCNGWEIGGGSIRMHNADMQERILRLIGAPIEPLSHLLAALRTGTPPHGGLAIGFDRLVALALRARLNLARNVSLRDVIAFPKIASGDPMSGAPAPLDENQRTMMLERIRAEEPNN